MIEALALLSMVVLFHATAFFAGRSWSDSGSSRLAHVAVAGLLLLWPLLSQAGPQFYFFDPPPPVPLLPVWCAWAAAALAVVGLARVAADRAPAEGAHRRAVLGRGTFACAVGLVAAAIALEALLTETRPADARSVELFLLELPSALFYGGTALGLVCSYAGMIEVRRRRQGPTWGPFSLLLFMLVAIASLYVIFEGIQLLIWRM